tara:strand:+ start:510 stop:1484 length:975 start_codon:yes stop_codon:yes gene_type:complete
VTDTEDNQPVLTDEEINALVEHATEVAGYDDGQFRSHDFNAGEALTLARWTELDALLRAHAEALEAALRHTFSIEVAVEPFAPLYAVAKNLMLSMPEPLCLVSTDIGPFAGESHLVLSGKTLSYLVNQYFGGGGVEPPKPKIKISPSEQRIGERLARDFLSTMTEMWADRLPLSPGDLYVDITADRLALMPADTDYVVLTYMLNVGDSHRSEIRLLLPYQGMAPHEVQLMPRKRLEPVEPLQPEWHNQLRQAVPAISVEVAGVLTTLDTSIRDLLAMHVGMVIPIEEPTEVQFTVDNRCLARGQYGAHQGARAVQFEAFEGLES